MAGRVQEVYNTFVATDTHKQRRSHDARVDDALLTHVFAVIALFSRFNDLARRVAVNHARLHLRRDVNVLDMTVSTVAADHGDR